MQRVFDGLGFREPDVVHVGKGFELGRDVDVGAEAGDEDAGVDEVGLAFGLARAQVGDEGVALLQVHSGAGEVEALVDIPTEGATDEERVVLDRVKAARGFVSRVAVAAGVKAGEFHPEPVAVITQFERGHLRIDVHALAGELVEAVFAGHLVKGMRDIQPADVSVAGPAEVERLDVMPLWPAAIGAKTALGVHRAEGRGPGQEAVLFVVRAAFIHIHVKAKLRGVALPNEVLAEDIRDQDVLMPRVERVQVRVSVLFAHVEKREVVLHAVVTGVAKEARAEIGVGENEAAEIRDERLDADAPGDEVVVIREVAEMNLGEGFLQRRELAVAQGVVRAGEVAALRRLRRLGALRGVLGGGIDRHQRPRVAGGLKFRRNNIENVPRIHRRVEAAGIAALRIHAVGRGLDGLDFRGVGRFRGSSHVGAARADVDEIVLAHADPVFVVHHVRADEPGHRLEGRLAFEKIDRERRIIGNKRLLAASEKLGTVRHRRAHAARHGQPAVLEHGEIFRRHVRENILAEDRHVAFQNALLVRMPHARRLVHVGRLAARVVVARPVRKGELPAVRPRLAVGQEAEPFAAEWILAIGESFFDRVAPEHRAARQAQALGQRAGAHAFGKKRVRRAAGDGARRGPVRRAGVGIELGRRLRWRLLRGGVRGAGAKTKTRVRGRRVGRGSVERPEHRGAGAGQDAAQGRRDLASRRIRHAAVIFQRRGGRQRKSMARANEP